MRVWAILVFWCCFCGAVFAEAVPMMRAGALALVEVRVGATGKPLRFLVDTGAEESVLSRRAARELGLEMVAKEQVRLPSGLRTVERSVPVALRVGRTAFATRGMLCLDLRREGRQLGTRLDGLLGMDFMEGRVVRLDFARGHFDCSAPVRRSGKAVVLPLCRNHGAVCVAVTAASKRYAMVRVDTGCDRGLCRVDAVDGRARGRAETIDLGLGVWTGRGIAGLCYRDAIFPGENGLLGMGALARFRSVTLDLPRGRMVLEQ